MINRFRKPSIVAVIASRSDFADIANLPRDSFHICELRLDLLDGASREIEELSRGIPGPKIATIRDPAEGGAHALPEPTRLERFERWLPHCDFIDVELRNLNRFSSLIQEAESKGKQVIVSFHDFYETPPIDRLKAMLDASGMRDTRIFKVATKTAQWSDVETLARFVQCNESVRVAAMGIGEFGKLSRLVLARLGSALVYGSIGEAVAPGQWPVSELGRILSEL